MLKKMGEHRRVGQLVHSSQLDAAVVKREKPDAPRQAQTVGCISMRLV